MSVSEEYATWFERITTFSPHGWQKRLGQRTRCQHLLIRVPTGLGKTAGTMLAWLYHRAVRDDPSWPRRFVLILPMHALVEQVENNLARWLVRAGLDHKVALHVLMPEVRTASWTQWPERLAILLGTQDMVLSRALNRGHGVPRGHWPMEFALLHQDALWVLDEVHLMNVGLLTSVQLAAFRARDAETMVWFRPARCWWMGATLDPDVLFSRDAADLLEPLTRDIVEPSSHERRGGVWNVHKRMERRIMITEPVDLAALALEQHNPGTLSLCVVNRVDHSVAVFRELGKRVHHGRYEGDAAPEIHLMHGRFRGQERRAWADSFLRAGAEIPAGGRILVCTSVIEASVDVSARLVITQMAPWPHLVQRAGRAGRVASQQKATIILAGRVPETDQEAWPYGSSSVLAARQAWQTLFTMSGDIALRELLALENRLRSRDSRLLGQLYAGPHGHLLQRSDMESLFDTTADLTGIDIDIGCFVQCNNKLDVWVLWRDVNTAVGNAAPARLDRDRVGAVHRDELCPVPVSEAQAWLLQVGTAYVHDYVEGEWVRLEPNRLAPGQLVLVPANQGGYDPVLGWDPRCSSDVAHAQGRKLGPEHELAGAGQDNVAARLWDQGARHDDDSLSIGEFQTIAAHGGAVARMVAELCDALDIAAPYKDELMLAARWHDAGKAHAVFQDAIAAEARMRAGPGAERRDLARAPGHAWVARPGMYARPGFRHELASALALLEFLRRVNPEHAALLGPDACIRELLAAAGMEPVAVTPDERVAASDPLAGELAELSAEAFDRVLYLVCSHHGTIRCAWHGGPKDEYCVEYGTEHGDVYGSEYDIESSDRHDQQHGNERAALGLEFKPVYGIVDGDTLAGLHIEDRAGVAWPVPALTLHLDAAALGLSGRYGASWMERVARLRARMSPFSLAFFETVLRVADSRASLPKAPHKDRSMG